MSGTRTGGLLGRALRGAVEGVGATIAMSGVLLASETAGVLEAQPPHLIVRKVMPWLPKPVSRRVAAVTHLAYGAAAGAAYRMVVPRSSSRVGGALFGILLWAAGYEGWVPALGIFPPAHRDDRGRQLTLFVAHVVFGATLGRRAPRPTKA